MDTSIKISQWKAYIRGAALKGGYISVTFNSLSILKISRLFSIFPSRQLKFWLPLWFVLLLGEGVVGAPLPLLLSFQVFKVDKSNYFEFGWYPSSCFTLQNVLVGYGVTSPRMTSLNPPFTIFSGSHKIMYKLVANKNHNGMQKTKYYFYNAARENHKNCFQNEELCQKRRNLT